MAIDSSFLSGFHFIGNVCTELFLFSFYFPLHLFVNILIFFGVLIAVFSLFLPFLILFLLLFVVLFVFFSSFFSPPPPLTFTPPPSASRHGVQLHRYPTLPQCSLEGVVVPFGVHVEQFPADVVLAAFRGVVPAVQLYVVPVSHGEEATGLWEKRGKGLGLGNGEGGGEEGEGVDLDL